MKMRLIMLNISFYFISEADVRRCSVRKVFLEISQNSQENTYARVYFFKTLTQVFLCEFCKISKNDNTLILYGNIVHKMQIQMSNFI